MILSSLCLDFLTPNTSPLERGRRVVKTAFIGGLSLASLHLCWVLIVLSGSAQALIDWVFKLHMLSSPFQVQPFSAGLAATLLLVTFAIGCFYGVVFELIRNLLSQQAK